MCVCVCACVQTHVHTSEKQRPDGLTPLLCLCPDHALCQWPCKEVPQEAVKDCQNLPLVSWNAWWTYKLGDGNDDDGKLARCSVFSCSSCPGRSLSKGTQEKGLKGIMEGTKSKQCRRKTDSTQSGHQLQRSVDQWAWSFFEWMSESFRERVCARACVCVCVCVYMSRELLSPCILMPHQLHGVTSGWSRAGGGIEHLSIY